MFWKWLMTGSAALLAFIGASLLACTYSYLAFVDALDICIQADLAVPGGSVAFGIVLIVAAISLVGYTWIPHLVDVRRQKGFEETGDSLAKNVHRLSGETGENEAAEDDLEPDGEQVLVNLSDRQEREPDRESDPSSLPEEVS
ncbi:MAG: hypothetical protein ACR2NL_08675 [Acidimicrobiia bacterium]